jgi:iron(III) transport system ATP-binding protein
VNVAQRQSAQRDVAVLGSSALPSQVTGVDRGSGSSRAPGSRAGSETGVAPGQPLVRLSQVSRYFGKAAAVDRIDLEIRQGEVFALLGASGCGKSTTLRMIAGLEPLDEGSIVMGARTLADSSTGRSLAPERRDIGIVFQSYAVWPHMTVAKNVEFPLKMRKVPRAERRARVAEILEVTGMDKWADRSATALSGGQQQRVALARALVYKPQLLLLDEPLSNLDAQLRTQMRREIRRLNQELGVTMLFVTHDQDEAFAVSDRVGVMSAGRLEQVGTPAEMYDHPATTFVRDFLGRMLSVSGTLEAGGTRVRLDPAGDVPGGEIGPLPHDDVRGTDGQRVRVFVRPEDVEVLADADAGGPVVNRIQARVLAADYLGDRMEYRVAVGDSTGGLNTHRRIYFTAGDVLWLRIDPARVSVWPQ